MGTTLTGTTPQDTYDSLIKVTDNGPLSGTAKYLSDGLGNDSVLALSTTAVGVGATTLFTKMGIANSLSATSIGTNYNAGILNIQNTNTTNGNLSLIGFQDASASINLAALGAINTTHSASPNSVVGELAFYTKPSGSGYVTEKMRITSAGNVGIGTDAPATYGFFVVNSSVASSGVSQVIRNSTDVGGDNTRYAGLDLMVGSDNGTAAIRAFRTNSAVDYSTSLALFTKGSGASATVPTERVRITHDGYLRMAASTGGIQFNGDTAAANALDDYEEGTWTPNFTVNAGSVSAYTSSGSYTKIGRQVSVTLSLVFTTTSSAQVDTITGLPFTAQNTTEIGIGAIRENTNSGDMWQWRVNANGTSGVLRRYDNDNTIANNDSFIGTLTYFV